MDKPSMDKPKIDSKSVETLCSFIENKTKKKRIELNPEYQRDVVWDNYDMEQYIDSIMNNRVASGLIFNKTKEGIYICIDGKQRTTSIYRYYKNKFFWTKNGKQVYYDEIPKDLEAHKCRVMTQEEKNHFDDYPISCYEYFCLPYKHQVEIFTSNHHGKSVSNAEQLLAYCKNIDIIKLLKKFVLENNSKLNKFINVGRKKDYEFVFRLLKLMNNSYNLTKKSLIEFIRKKDDFKIIKDELKKIGKTIDFFHKLDMSRKDFIGHSFLILCFCSIKNDILDEYIVKKYITKINELKDTGITRLDSDCLKLLESYFDLVD